MERGSSSTHGACTCGQNNCNGNKYQRISLTAAAAAAAPDDDKYAEQAIDLQSVAIGEEGRGVLVQDTDLSYRPRPTYTQWEEQGAGWWQVCAGKKKDNVPYLCKVCITSESLLGIPSPQAVHARVCVEPRCCLFFSFSDYCLLLRASHRPWLGWRAAYAEK